jgi:hypothetical protein
MNKPPLCPDHVRKAFDKQVTEYLLKHGTYELKIDNRTLLIEIDCYDRDDKPNGFVAWWDDEQGVQTLGDTPSEAYWDAF